MLKQHRNLTFDRVSRCPPGLVPRFGVRVSALHQKPLADLGNEKPRESAKILENPWESNLKLHDTLWDFVCLEAFRPRETWKIIRIVPCNSFVS